MPFGGVLVLVGVVGIFEQFGAGSIVVGGASIAFGVAVLCSAAFSSWGEMEVRRLASSWTITWRLWRWSRASSFQQRELRTADIYSPPPYTILWPGASGLQLRIELDRRERPLFVGAGLQLPSEILQCLRDLLDPGLPG